MSHMPGAFAKPKILTRLDDLSAPANKAKFQAAFAELKTTPPVAYDPNGPDLIDWARKHGVTVTVNEEDHLKNHWFDYWWKPHQPTAPVIKQGLIKAFDLAINNSVPLDCYWACSEDAFQVFSLLSAQQVTMIVLTPPPPLSGYGVTYPDSENIWLVKHMQVGVGPGENVLSKPDGVYLVQLLKDNLP